KLEQPREQPSENHGVGDVGDMEFIEAQKPGFFRDRGRRALDRIVLAGLAVLDILPVDMNALVHVGHEFVEMHAAFANDCTGFKKEIHQHRLAAANLSVDVEALKGRVSLFTFSEKPAE